VRYPVQGNRQVNGSPHEEIQPADPKARRRALVIVLVIASLGLATVVAVNGFFQELEALARADPERAAQQLVGALKILAAGLALCLLGASGWLCNLSRRTYGSQRFPPPGVAVVRDVRVAIGAKARRRALLGFGLSGLTALAAAAVLWQIWRMIDVLTQGAG
jgi:hypothetical protein